MINLIIKLTLLNVCYKIADLKDSILIFPTLSYILIVYLLFLFFYFIVKLSKNFQKVLVFTKNLMGEII